MLYRVLGVNNRGSRAAWGKLMLRQIDNVQLAVVPSLFLASSSLCPQLTCALWAVGKIFRLVFDFLRWIDGEHGTNDRGVISRHGEKNYAGELKKHKK